MCKKCDSVVNLDPEDFSYLINHSVDLFVQNHPDMFDFIYAIMAGALIASIAVETPKESKEVLSRATASMMILMHKAFSAEEPLDFSDWDFSNG